MKAATVTTPVAGDLMSVGVLSVYSGASVMRAVSAMIVHRVGRMVVVDGEEPIGIFTERNLIDKVIARRQLLTDVEVDDVMSRITTKGRPEQSLQQAASASIKANGSLLIFKEGKMQGMVTSTDVVKGIYRTGIPFDISEMVSDDVLRLDAQTPVAAVIKEMAARKVGSVIVTRRDAPNGIFTERDILEKVIGESINDTVRIGDIASFKLTTAGLGIGGKEAAEIMVSRRIKRLPLTDGTKIVGIVTARDLVEAFAEADLDFEKEMAENAKVRYGEVCPVCSTRIDSKGLCGCGAGGE